MGLFSFLQTREQLVAIDIGSTGIKALELDLSGERPRVLQLGHAPLSGEIFSNNSISKPDVVAEQLGLLLGQANISSRLAAAAVPGPSVFTKKILMPRVDPDEFDSNIHMEAANVIPHNIDAVHLDYHIIRELQKGQLEVLVVAVKNEIIDSVSQTLLNAGVETVVVDVDYFALQNIFEHAYPEFSTKTVALVNIGARYAAVNICRGGQSLFTGDISVSSKPAVDQLAIELNRQLSFFWNATGAEGGVDQIFVSGGGGAVEGLVPALQQKSGIMTELLAPFRAWDFDAGVDRDFAAKLEPLMAVAAGLALRQPGDKDYSLLE